MREFDESFTNETSLTCKVGTPGARARGPLKLG